MEKTEEKKQIEKEASKSARAGCDDKNCHVHGGLKTRGKVFEGEVIAKYPKRVAIQFERMVYVRKYERYKKNKTKIHARLPDCMRNEIQIGDLIRIQECRPLSKIIHFVVLGKVEKETKAAPKGVRQGGASTSARPRDISKETSTRGKEKKK
jgi:small subunit ribosomal protein S17